ncbi:MAG: isoamylase early set domain-containing protein [Gemmatimonadota bacterium]|nr:isoamylase early set domain-containing protein [Gemmatimonadota bacterium]MDH3367920.1 isoamylase early set domain-containing protein [Gemmatimonadota bacterium]MDH3478006.1 isoamylase early set domain-containing protein [Gemmatimonadota bacterium]MDH3568792.1 isoamylase early set domain-containing protein [Gemmatimonadota bacterium]MDH5549430.1 isoamylase early set domain-containing protein [Gemmatimonadota bacterium]
MTERGFLFDRVVEILKEPVAIDPALDRRVIKGILAGPSPRAAPPAVVGWLTRRRTVSVSPLGGLALAAGIAGLALLGRSALQLAEPSTAPRTATVAASTEPAPSVVQFVIVAPSAATVSLVGDFNDWNVSATPMRPAPGDGIWSVTVPLEPGRYRYAFLVDGQTWLADPSAPRAFDDDFGPPNSVLTVRGS